MKTLLIATTALIGIALLAEAGELPTRQAASEFYKYDANQRFLCTFGFSVFNSASRTHSKDPYEISYTWSHAAAPVLGTGKTVNKIIVAEAPSEYTTQGFSVAIYLGTPPVHELRNQQVGPPKKCGRVTVPISPIRLAKGKTYWIVETALRPQFGNNSSSIAVNGMEWLYDEKRTGGGLWQSGYSCYRTHCSDHQTNPEHYYKSPWQDIGHTPYVRVPGTRTPNAAGVIHRAASRRTALDPASRATAGSAPLGP